MRVCYFGTYEKNYPRNRNVIEGLIKQGVEVVECHVGLYSKMENKVNLGVGKYIFLLFSILFSYLKLIFKRLALIKVDAVIVGYPGQLDMFLARLLFLNKKIIFNPMLSIYDTIIEDRGLSSNFFVKKVLYFLDRFSCLLANKIVLDTPEHADYFARQFNISRNKIYHSYIGADENIFYQRSKLAENKFRVLFYGKFSPLHGIDTIVRAAKILSTQTDVEFEIIGTGQVHKDILNLVKELEVDNIKFTDWVDFEKLPDKIAQADVCLGGHFGSSDKGQRVVANKVFQMIAMKKPVVIADCLSSKNAGFIDKENCLLCPAGDAESLAKIILLVKNDYQLADKVSQGALELFANSFTVEKIGRSFKKILDYKLDSVWIPTPAYMMRKKIIIDYITKNNLFINNFLEIGFGSGDMIKSISKFFKTGQGIDSSLEAINVAKKNVLNPNISFKQSNFLEDKIENKYQMIIALEVLEHIENDKLALEKIYKMLEDKGQFIMSVPAHQSKWSVLDRWAGHYRRYEKKELISLCESLGFKVIKFYNYGFPLLNILWFIRKRLIKDDKVKISKNKNTSRSGLDRSTEKKFKFFFNNFFVSPFYLIQKLFVSFDFSPAYLVILKK